jgi:oligopeptide/dipeptide ABC transporter ATP-binding protein
MAATVREATAAQAGALLEVRGLTTEFRSRDATIRANADVSLTLERAATLGIVGESGSGKSVLCRSILRLIPSPPGFISAGEVRFEGRDLLRLNDEEIRRVRGTQIGMVFQNPMTSLNPVWPIGDQITEGLRVHDGLPAAAARDRGIELLGRVGIPSPAKRYDEYPFQWSGGMLQRAVIAMAMAGEPKLLLADEPTTALDVTIQDQILALLLELQDRNHMAMILVSHDLAVVAETCDSVAVMYAGRIVEVAPTQQLFEAPRHPYTLGLLSSIPRSGDHALRLVPIAGQPPSLADLPAGCPFVERCRFASADCAMTPVRLREVAPGHASACLYPERIAGEAR